MAPSIIQLIFLTRRSFLAAAMAYGKDVPSEVLVAYKELLDRKMAIENNFRVRAHGQEYMYRRREEPYENAEFTEFFRLRSVVVHVCV